MVLTRNDNDLHLTGEVVPRRVRQTIVTRPHEVWEVTYRTPSGAVETLTTTAAHPFFVCERLAFVMVHKLNMGDTFSLANDNTATVIALSFNKDDGDRRVLKCDDLVELEVVGCLNFRSVECSLGSIALGTITCLKKAVTEFR